MHVHKKGCRPIELEHPFLHIEAALCYTVGIKADMKPQNMLRNLNIFNCAFLIKDYLIYNKENLNC